MAYPSDRYCCSSGDAVVGIGRSYPRKQNGRHLWRPFIHFRIAIYLRVISMLPFFAPSTMFALTLIGIPVATSIDIVIGPSNLTLVVPSGVHSMIAAFIPLTSSTFVRSEEHTSELQSH